MIFSLFLSCSLRNYICCSRWFINLSYISFVEFKWTCSLGLCLILDSKNSFLKLLNFSYSWILPRFAVWGFQYLPLKRVFLSFHHFLSIFGFLLAATSIPWFPTIFSLTDWFRINSSKSLSKVSLVTSSTESLNNLKTSSFPHFLFPRFIVWMKAINNISSFLSS